MITILAEPLGGARTLQARWEVSCRLILHSAAHIGGGEQVETLDMAILRDARTGVPLLTGASLAGSMRNYLLKRLGWHGLPELKTADLAAAPQEMQPRLRGVTELFGGARGDDDGSQSCLIVHDAFGNLAGGAIEVRDGIVIDPVWGSTREGFKFEYEVLPKGSIFELFLELLVETGRDELQLTGMLLGALAGFDGAIHLGARRQRGLGRCRAATWRARRWDLCHEAGWQDWLLADDDGWFCGETLLEVFTRAWGGALVQVAPLAPEQETWTAVLRLQLQEGQGILIRSPGLAPEDPDSVHLQSGGAGVVTGTSLGGALRARARLISRLFMDNTAAESLVNDMFGPFFPDGQVRAVRHASRISVEEGYIHGGSPEPVVRTAIDRFTQGVVTGALFEEAPWQGGEVLVKLVLHPNGGDERQRNKQIGLFLLLVRDLISGELPVGGTSSIGRGFLRGGATITGMGQTMALQADQAPGGTMTISGAATFQQFMDALAENV